MENIATKLNKVFFKIENELNLFEKKKKKTLIASFFIKAYNVLFAVVVLSYILGFINAFPFDEFDAKFISSFFKFFFLFVMLIVVLQMSNNLLKEWYIRRNPEKLKNKAAIWTKRIIITVLIISIAYVAGTSFLGDEILSKSFFLKFGIGIASMLVLILPVLYLKTVEKKFYREYKNVVLPSLMKHLDSNISYKADEMLPKETFKSSKLFHIHEIYRYRGSDLIEGESGDSKFRLSYLEVFDKEVQKSKGKTETQIKQIFNGMLYVSNLNKNFQGHTIIVPDYSREILGKVAGEMLNEFLGTMGKKLVKLEDPEFESDFSVYSTDQIEARYILTPSFIERIKEVKNHFNHPVRFSFFENSVYIAIYSNNNILDPNIFRKLNSEREFEYYSNNMLHLLNISTDLKLNISIWK